MQFNREKTTRTTSSSPPITTPPQSIHSGFGNPFPLKSQNYIPSSRASTNFTLSGTGDPNVGGTGTRASSQGGGGGGGSNNNMGGKDTRIQKTSHTSTNNFSNMSAVGGTLGSPTAIAPGRDGQLNSNSSGANNIRSTSSSSKPCCFCWCCCCSCSW